MKNDKDYIKANRKGSREAELENGNGWTSKHKVHKTQKDYSRKGKSKFVFDEDEEDDLFEDYLFEDELFNDDDLFFEVDLYDDVY